MAGGAAAVAVAAAVWGAGTATARAQAAAPVSSGAAPTLDGLACHRALNPAQRSVAVTALMHPLSGSSRLAVDFRLLRRAPGDRFTPVHGTGLGSWLTKQFGPGSADSWQVIHTVRDLSAPASYRFSVAFRWIGSSGRVIARAARLSRVCRQPELRPDLQVLAIDVQPDVANARDDVYRTEIHDSGATGAGPFQIQLAAQGTIFSTRSLTRISAHRSAWVSLTGPLCNGAQPPIVTVDPHHRVDVYSRSESSLAASCPAAPSGTSGSSAG